MKRLAAALTALAAVVAPLSAAAEAPRSELHDAELVDVEAPSDDLVVELEDLEPAMEIEVTYSTTSHDYDEARGCAASPSRADAPAAVLIALGCVVVLLRRRSRYFLQRAE